MSRRAVGTALVGAWVVCVGWLAVRQVSRPPEAFLDAAGGRLAPGAAFYQVILGGTPIGNAGITLDTTLTGYRLTETWNIDLLGDRGRTRHVLRSESGLTRSLRLRSQVINRSEGGQARQTELTWGPRDDSGDSAFTVVIRRPGERRGAVHLARDRTVSVPTALAYRLAAERRLGTSGSVSQRVASPLTEQMESQTVRVLGDTLVTVVDSAAWDSTASRWIPIPGPAATGWRLERLIDGMPAREVVDGRGFLIRREMAFGPALERSPFEINYNSYQADLRRGAVELPRRVPGVTRRTDLPGRPDSTLREIRLKVSRSDGPAWPNAALAFAGGRQSVRGDTVVIHRDTPAPGAAPSPEAGSAVPSPAVVATHREALSVLPAGGDTLTHLVSWVAGSVRLVPDSVGAGAVGATGAARDRIATLEGKVALFVELARASGLPARAVTGVDVARLELPSHTWAEVWRGDRWVAVDPAFGQAPASASLLRVTDGALARPLALVPLVGALRATLVAESR